MTETGSEIDVDQESDGGEAIEVEEGLDEDEDEVMEDGKLQSALHYFFFASHPGCRVRSQ